MDQLYQIEDNNGLFDTEESDFWIDHQEALYSILILLFQSIENYLKKEICLESPLLIISTPPSRWANKPFNKLFIYGFDDLLRIYCEIKNITLNQPTFKELQNIKNTRNSIVHGVHQDILFPENVMEYIFLFLKDLWGKEWLKDIKPFIAYDWLSSSDTIFIWRYVALFQRYLDKNRTCLLIGGKISHSYVCPNCHYENIESMCIEECDYSYFIKKNDGEYLICPICENEFKLTNETCKNMDCKQRLIHSEEHGYFCLNCF